MPIFTFVCDGCACSRDVVCKVAERATMTMDCENTQVPDGDNWAEKCPGVLRWAGGIEGATVVQAEGKYKFQLIGDKGQRWTSPKAKTKAR